MEKSCAYWFDKYTHKLVWLIIYNWKWVKIGYLSKSFGTPFCLNLNILDIDQFLYTEISKKLDYLRTMKFSMFFHCNHVLLSTLWFFHEVLGALNKILQKIKGEMRNYHWYGEKQLTRTKVNWKECCMKKKYNGFRLVDLEAPKTTSFVNGSSSYGAR